MLKFFFAKKSCAFASHVALEEVQANYEAIQINLEAGEQHSESFIKVNPKKRVPALVTPNGTITETIAILQFISSMYPEKKLMPTDPFLQAEAQSFNSYLASTVHVAHAHKHRGLRWTRDKVALDSLTAHVTENMDACAKFIEYNLFKGPWVLGKRYSVCDPYLAVITRWFKEDGVNLKQYQAITEHNNLIGTRPAVQTVLKLHDLT